MNVLLTGGAGFVGTHVAVALVEAGHDVVLVDNFSNSHPEAVRRLGEITGRELACYAADCTDATALSSVFEEHRIDAVVHCAGLKAVGESTERPTLYYRTNLDAVLTLVETMAEHEVYRLVFSSSATIYGDPQTVPIPEDAPLTATNPYGATKLFAERILTDLAAADPRWRVTNLRYFNPIGAHPSGLIGEDPDGVPNNLFPYIAQVAAGRRERLQVFGADYATPDGTGVRDYLHVLDLAEGHVAALEHLDEVAPDPDTGTGRCRAYNLGTGRGLSVLEAIKAFEEASSRPVPHEITQRRPGDIAVCYADPSRAQRELGWQARRDVATACADAWRWQSRNPGGFTG
ncbi:UDP-glucose 4-epimerase GalE [Lipingzhangella sp. LS1_29]|uniref:UDP-glucose 4-epimerase n=1 Tax=Lipingzhangella rawalii TaxID=2055835 RepID=A0ABU2H4X5_9ACTN|nr:UDP-glucose 4-epimerase GalE [Lipingzhangella rawalii]MDS1269870.1 UDP-glucose 4-epimerase GalE [Lipingzhangella rawalii]